MIEIVPFENRYGKAFKELNQWWIEKYFVMESQDHMALDHPQEYIIDNGGHILVALSDDKPVGVCALIKSQHEGYDYELAKMGVSRNSHGKGIGYQLGLAIIAKAKACGAKKIHLESNTKLKPAINLYHKLGFKKVEGLNSPYSRCNIQMELLL